MTTPQPAATMTKQEAIEAMKQGHRVTHRFFGSSEWIRLIGGRVFAEDGVTIADSIEDFLTHEYRTNLTWDADWSIFVEPVEAEGYGYQPKDTVDTSNPPRQKAGSEATGKSPEVEQFKERLKARVAYAKQTVSEELQTFPVGTTGSSVRVGRLNALKWVLKLIDETK